MLFSQFVTAKALPLSSPLRLFRYGTRQWATFDFCFLEIGPGAMCHLRSAPRPQLQSRSGFAPDEHFLISMLVIESIELSILAKNNAEQILRRLYASQTDAESEARHFRRSQMSI